MHNPQRQKIKYKNTRSQFSKFQQKVLKIGECIFLQFTCQIFCHRLCPRPPLIIQLPSVRQLLEKSH